MEPLQQMAALAVNAHLKGRSFKRNSLLKPLDIILENLEREPKEDVRDLVRRASERQIFDHIDAITPAKYKPGLAKREQKMDQIRAYVDLFFDGVLAQAHRGDVNRLLQRNKLIRSAYLIYYRDALPESAREQADTEQMEEVHQAQKENDTNE